MHAKGLSALLCFPAIRSIIVMRFRYKDAFTPLRADRRSARLAHRASSTGSSIKQLGRSPARTREASFSQRLPRCFNSSANATAGLPDG